MKSYFLRRNVSRGPRRTVSFGRSRSAVSLSRSKSGILRQTSQRQLGKKPSATGRRRPGTHTSTWSRFNECCECKYFTIVITLLLFTGVITMIILYFRKLKKLSERANAVVAIRNFMIHHNKSFQGKSDAEILAGAQQLAKYLLDCKSESDEIQRAFDSTIGKLATGWKQFRGSLYLFSNSILPFRKARQACNNTGGMLVDIASDEEEDFVEEETFKEHSPYWIGLVKINGTWLWLDNQTLTAEYWVAGGLDEWGGREENCAEIERCTTKRQCWNAVSCDEKNKWICKVKPNPKWL